MLGNHEYIFIFAKNYTILQFPQNYSVRLCCESVFVQILNSFYVFEWPAGLTEKIENEK